MKTEYNTDKILLLGFDGAFIKCAEPFFCHADFQSGGEYSITAISEKCAVNGLELSTDILLCPQKGTSESKIKCNSIVTCGMNKKSTLSFSSVSFGSALLSQSRSISYKQKILYQCEKPVEYKEKLTLYENIILQGICLILKHTP